VLLQDHLYCQRCFLALLPRCVRFFFFFHHTILSPLLHASPTFLFPCFLHAAKQAASLKAEAAKVELARAESARAHASSVAAAAAAYAAATSVWVLSKSCYLYSSVFLAKIQNHWGVLFFSTSNKKY
jgi:hypothetical protein